MNNIISLKQVTLVLGLISLIISVSACNVSAVQPKDKIIKSFISEDASYNGMSVGLTDCAVPKNKKDSFNLNDKKVTWAATIRNGWCTHNLKDYTVRWYSPIGEIFDSKNPQYLFIDCAGLKSYLYIDKEKMRENIGLWKAEVTYKGDVIDNKYFYVLESGSKELNEKDIRVLESKIADNNIKEEQKSEIARVPDSAKQENNKGKEWLIVPENIKEPSIDSEMYNPSDRIHYSEREELLSNIKKVGVLMIGTIPFALDKLSSSCQYLHWDRGSISSKLLGTKVVYNSKYNLADHLLTVAFNLTIIVDDDGYRPIIQDGQAFIPIEGHMDAIYDNVRYAFGKLGYETIIFNKNSNLSSFDDNKTVKEIIGMARDNYPDIDAVLIVFYVNSGMDVKYMPGMKEVETGLNLHALMLMYYISNSKIALSSYIAAYPDDIPKEKKTEMNAPIFGGKTITYNPADLLKIFYQRIQGSITNLVPARHKL
jgi:hypothetical protein